VGIGAIIAVLAACSGGGALDGSEPGPDDGSSPQSGFPTVADDDLNTSFPTTILSDTSDTLVVVPPSTTVPPTTTTTTTTTTLVVTTTTSAPAPDCPLPPVASDVLFDTGSDELRPGAEEPLRAMAETLTSDFASFRFLLVGHTDSRASAEYNQDLSERRAERVREWLLESGGVPADSVDAVGRGETELLEDDHPGGVFDEAAGAVNRRVEVFVIGLQAEDPRCEFDD